MLFATFANKKNSKKLKLKQSKRLGAFRIAVIDLGTNSVRMDVYRVSGAKVIRVYRTKLMVRLGDGVFQTGRLSVAGQLRTFRAFVGFKKTLRQMKVHRIAAFGTSALRTAKNTPEFLRELTKRSGIAVQVISGEAEGRLIAKGILSNIKPPGCTYALVDIGGGSTEISICRGNKVLHSHSYKLGANRLQQIFLKESPPAFKSGQLYPVLALRQHLKSELQSLVRLGQRYPIEFVIGSSGTIRSIGKIMRKNSQHEKMVMRPDVSALAAELQTMTREQIKKIPGLEPKRIDLILSGSVLLEEVLLAMSVKHLVVTDLALRDGILQQEIENIA